MPLCYSVHPTFRLVKDVCSYVHRYVHRHVHRHVYKYVHNLVYKHVYKHVYTQVTRNALVHTYLDMSQRHTHSNHGRGYDPCDGGPSEHADSHHHPVAIRTRRARYIAHEFGVAVVPTLVNAAQSFRRPRYRLEVARPMCRIVCECAAKTGVITRS